MPTFRSAPSGSLTEAVRRLVASGGGKLSPLQEMQADQLAAQNSRNMSLAEKARAEVEAMRAAETQRNDPAVRTEYAAHSAGINLPEATQLARHIRGEMDPNPQGPADAADNVYGDVAVGRPENLPAGSERQFRSALASLIGNSIATGKTNAEQLAGAGKTLNEAGLTTEAAHTSDLPTANRIVAAVAGKVREPFKVGPQGQVLNEETGALNEATALARAAAALSGAKGKTEGAKVTELGTRSSRNTAQTGLATERAAAVKRGETGRGGVRVTPQQVERWVNEVARKEWDVLPPSQRKGMNYEQHLTKVRERFKTTGTRDARQEIEDAHAAIVNGAAMKMVAKRFKERMGFDMPAPPVVVDDDEDDED